MRRGLFGCSLAAIAAATGAAGAEAACTPNPPQRNGTTTCSDRTDGGIVAATNATVTVAAGATLAGGNGNPAFTATNSGDVFGTAIGLNVNGRIDGAGAPGVIVTNGSPGTSNATTFLTIAVAAGGSIEGSSAIVLRPQLAPQGNFGNTVANVDNGGSIRAASGAAIVAATPQFSGFYSVNNRAGGFIGGIDATVRDLVNAGTIDGGSLSAYRYADPASGGFAVFPSSIVNSGTMRSAGAADTIGLPAGFLRITNSGTIANGSAGIAINAAGPLAVDNQAGGTIASAGPVALRSGQGLTLTNRGSVIGSVTAAGYGSVIDTVGGTIRGDVLLGLGDDRVIGTLDAGTGRFVEISGRVDGGAGTNTAEFVVAADATLSTIATPANFQQVQFTLRGGAAVTFTGDTSSGLTLAGTGSFVNTGRVASNGPAISSAYVFPQDLSFTNRGTITATLARPSDYAVQIGFAASFANENAITAIGGNGVLISGNYPEQPFTNSGTITATGTAFTASSGPVANTGTIRSTGETGARISLGGGTVRTVTSTNSGLIEGATLGLATDSITLVNTGTIRATNGIGVDPSFYSTIDNRAGGVISGTVAGIGFSRSSGYAAIVRNAGTIVGDVNFAPQPNFYGSGNNVYIDEGGTIDGTLRLGSGGLLVTDLARIAGGRFAGATGTVDPGTNGELRLRVAADASLAIASLPGFATAGYELSNGAALKLVADRPLATSVALAGKGSVDITADIATVDRPVVAIGVPTVNQYLDGSFYPTSMLSVVSRGALSFTRTSSSAGFAGVTLASGSTFENAGTLAVTAGAGTSGATAIFGGFYASDSTAVNSGSITLAGAATGIGGVGSVVNSGRIVQAAGDAGATTGVAAFATLRNSGTIETRGIAVDGRQSYPNLIANSGRIASATDAAIAVSSSGGGRIENLAGGTIVGGNGVALRSGGGITLVNAGGIVGDVLLNGFPNSSFYSSTYVANGGTVAGNLVFGDGDDVLLVRDGVTGVSGTINGGRGQDAFGTFFDRSGTAVLGGPLPASFETYAAGASGRDTVVTLTGPTAGIANGLALSGDGAFVNQVDVRGRLGEYGYGVRIGDSFAQSETSQSASFTNQATIASGVAGFLRAFANSGTIGTATSVDNVYLTADGREAFSFSNAGTIVGTSRDIALSARGAVEIYQYATFPADGAALSIANSGQISGGLFSYTGSTAATFTNSGVVDRRGGFVPTVQLANYTGDSSTLTAANSGTIRAAGSGSIAMLLSAAASGDGSTVAVGLTNSGLITAEGFGFAPQDGSGLAEPTVAVAIQVPDGSAVSVVNAAGGTIAAPSAASIALVANGDLTLVNGGTISGGAGVRVSTEYPSVIGGGYFFTPDGFLAGAVQTFGGADLIRNAGTITGSIDLGAGDDRIENTGTINGNVYLRAGDDSFVQRAGALLGGIVDGGDGIDGFVVDAGGGGAIDAARLVNFESLAQRGAGSVAYSGNFGIGTIRIDGGTATVAAGSTVATAGPIAFTGGDGSESIVNLGTIAGAVALGGGSDS